MLRRGTSRFCSVGGVIQLQVTTQLSTKALRSKWKKRSKSSSHLAFPPAFTENLRRWQKLLKMEISANERVIRYFISFVFCDAAWGIHDIIVLFNLFEMNSFVRAIVRGSHAA
uniref:Uncharacterized protein n=1 Tax=Parascaris univalens TaxID=6257 RepID=A0A915CET1_PARUN